MSDIDNTRGVVWDYCDNAETYQEKLLQVLRIKLNLMDDFAMNPYTHCVKHGKIKQMENIINYIENETI